MSKHGELTAEIGAALKFEGYDVLYDHDISSENVGKIVSTLKKNYGRDNELSQLDIAVVKENSDIVVLLVEIEETSDRPKTFLGDIFGVLFGNYVYFRKRELHVGIFTTLVTVGISKSEHVNRNQHIQECANSVKAGLETNNSKIGKIVIRTYRNEKDMLANLPGDLEIMVNGTM